MCTVIVKREMLRQSDIMCSVSKNPNDLRACLKNRYEKLLSYFVTVKFLREPVDMVRSNLKNNIDFWKHCMSSRKKSCLYFVFFWFLSFVCLLITLFYVFIFYKTRENVSSLYHTNNRLKHCNTWLELDHHKASGRMWHQRTSLILHHFR